MEHPSEPAGQQRAESRGRARVCKRGEKEIFKKTRTSVYCYFAGASFPESFILTSLATFCGGGLGAACTADIANVVQVRSKKGAEARELVSREPTKNSIVHDPSNQNFTYCALAITFLSSPPVQQLHIGQCYPGSIQTNSSRRIPRATLPLLLRTYQTQHAHTHTRTTNSSLYAHADLHL